MVAIGNTLIPLLGKFGRAGGYYCNGVMGKDNREVVNGKRKEVGRVGAGGLSLKQA